MAALVQHFQIEQRAENPQELHNALRSIFGNGGRVLEKIIVKEFYKKLGLRLVEDTTGTFDLQETILEARTRLGLALGTFP